MLESTLFFLALVVIAMPALLKAIEWKRPIPAWAKSYYENPQFNSMRKYGRLMGWGVVLLELPSICSKLIPIFT